MNNIDIANGLVFKALRIGKESFDERLISQKKIFLAQELGVDLGYSYNWYIRGPYSPDLTAYMYENINVLSENSFAGYALSPEANTIIETVNDFASSKPTELSEEAWYELLASARYIHASWGHNSDLYEKLIEYKPQFNKSQFERARQVLAEVGLVGEEVQ